MLESKILGRIALLEPARGLVVLRDAVGCAAIRMRGFSTIGPLIPNRFYGFRRLSASWVVRVIRPPTSIALGARMFEQIMREQPDVDAVRTPRTEMGPAAARMLLALMSGEAMASSCVDLGYELVVRAST